MRKSTLSAAVNVTITALLIMITIAIAVVTLESQGGADAKSLQEVQYCDMVRLHQESDGEFGWPDYNRNFKEVCND